jgi:hypothetical protein
MGNHLAVRFSEFEEMLDREEPETLPVGLIAKVRPVPWILRAGHGKDARIRMIVGGSHRYERSQGEEVWTRTSDSAGDFDILDDAA